MSGFENSFLAPTETLFQKDSLNLPKKEKLFGHCFRMKRLENGDELGVGGSILDDEASIKLEVDTENFEGFIRETGKLADAYKLDKLRAYLDSAGIDMDERIFADLFAFTKGFESSYLTQENAEQKRKELYSKRESGVPKLSEAFKTGSVECAEIAALAQLYLQSRGIESSYISGDVLWDKAHEFSEEHSFILLQSGDKEYVFDPMNPTSTTQGNYPGLYELSSSLSQADLQKKLFLEGTNIINQKKAYYGVNNATNIQPEKDIKA